MTFHIEAVFCGLIAYVVGVILTDSEMLLNKVYHLFKRLPDWLFKPLIGCTYCMAGQYGLWTYLYLYWNDYNLLSHVLFISVSILAVEIILQTINRLTR